MTSPVIEAMARTLAKEYGNFNYDAFGDASAEKYRRMAKSAMKALEENITDEMISEGWSVARDNLDAEFLSAYAVKQLFTAMLRAAREE